MTSLYALFFLVALILFAAIAGISWWQQKSRVKKLAIRDRGGLSDSDDPLLTDNNASSSAYEVAVNDKVSTPRSKSIPTLDSYSEPEVPAQAKQSDGKAKAFGAGVKAGVKASGIAVKKAIAGDAENESQRLDSTADKPPQLDTANVVRGPSSKSSAQFDINGNLITELVARVKNPEPIEQHDLLTLFREYDFKFQRKVHIFGLNQMTDDWCDIEYEQPSARFVELGLSIELADPRGAMTKKESHDFQQMTLELTNRFNANFEFSMGIDAAEEQAQFLDEIGRRFDSMAVLNVVPKTKTGFRIADIESCARDLMMSTDKNGIFMKTQGHKDDIDVLYRLACTDGTGQFGIVGGGAAASGSPVHDLVIYMNVPATSDPDLVFQEMIKDANSLATWLEGRVVDKNGRAVSQRSYTALMKQIAGIAEGMREQGLSPGDAVSRKLF